MFKPLLALALTATLSLGAPYDDTPEAQLIRLLDEWDAAVAQQDWDALEERAAEAYVYVEPRPDFREELPPQTKSKSDRLAHRLTRELGWADATPQVQIIGETAIVTGSYRLFKPDLLVEGSPRLVSQGMFTTTWIREQGQWRLWAEHRSLNDVQAWSGAVAQSVRQPEWATAQPPPRVVAAPNSSGPEQVEPKPSRRKIYEETGQTRRHRGAFPESFIHVFRAYEPTSIGMTWDEGDDPFMDFSFSPMVALHGSAADYPGDMRWRTDQKLSRPLRLSAPSLYFAATIRAGQYISTRPSSPVVGKRFNPLLSLRLWGEDAQGRRESMGNFLEFVYAHESNGQFISSPQRFDEQARVYRNQALDAETPEQFEIAVRTARRSARDNISRGWDYLGVQFARDWDAKLPWSPLPVTMALHARFNYYLDEGFMQGPKEEYNFWENDPAGKPRSQTDGLSLRYTVLVDPWREGRDFTFRQNLIRLERRYDLTWTTGYEKPFQFNTLKAEATLMLLDVVPLTIWARYGYNSDLTDYYRRDRSLGFALSYWNF